MVDAVVSFTVERLGELLIQEAVFLHGVRGQVEQLCTELTTMQCFLKDADEKQHLQGNELVRNWVAQIRDVAYDAEDVIDSFILNAASSERRREGIQGFLMRNNPYKIIINKPIRLHKVGTEIGAILARLQDISTSRIKFGIKDVGGDHGTGEASSSSTSRLQLQQQLRESYSHVENEDVVGLEEPTKKLVAELMKVEEQRRVISIIGIGGLGKTTLAKKVYNHKQVQSHFNCCAWTFISQQYSRRDVLQQILKKASSATDEEIKNMTEVDLVEKLHRYLKEKRYLVVLDDIWSEEAWDAISPAFPIKGKKMGSKVLLTTRNQDVASHADPWSLHLKPRLLTDDEGWKLLYRKVFPKNLPADAASKYCSSELEELGRKMVGKCGGLPLGVSILGGLLVKKDIIEWDVVLRDINAYMNKGGRDGGVSGILSLSYNDLPCHLKPCFLYLGLFPEDYAIRTGKLIKLWMAEGFIPQKKGAGGLTMEEVGKHQYLAELIQRCMIQVDERSLYTGGVRTCRVHDLMRDLCLSKAREVNFLDIYEYDRHHHHDQNLAAAVDSNPIVGASPTTNHMIRLRRHAIHHKGSVDMMIRFDYLQNSTYSHIRTLLVLPNLFAKITNWYQNIKLLRVLDLQSVRVDKNATEQIGKLIHLRYLALNGGGFEMETSSAIGNLRNLQTLILISFGGWLPEKIARMEQLRYLNVYNMLINLKISEKWLVGNYLINLQTLKHVSAVGWLTKDCGFEKLTSLRTLKMEKLLRSQIEEVILPYIVARSSSSSSNHNYPGLTSLTLCCQRGEEFPNLEPLSLCHKLLKLCLEGRCSKSENLLLLSVFPPNLTNLTLSKTYLNQDPMATLQHLPNLKFLCMHNSYSGEEMVCSAQGFPKLQFLDLQFLKQLKEWRVDQGGMPSLKHLGIHGCRKLRMLPEGLKFITTLQQLTIGWMSEELKARIERGSGDDWYKIQHIPSITF